MPPTKTNEYLIERYVTETLSKSEERLLLERIRQDSGLAKRLLEHIYVDMSIRRLQYLGEMPDFFSHASSDRPTDEHAPLDFDMLIRLAAESPPISKQPQILQSESRELVPVLSRPQRMTSSTQTGRTRVFLASIVVFAALIPCFRFWTADSPSKSAISTKAVSNAQVTYVADSVFPGKSRAFRSGHAIGKETVQIASGFLELRLTSGVRIVMEGETTLDIQAPEKVFCQKGRVSVEVPKGAEGFEVRTPLMNVKDLGTKFVVDVSDAACAVHVIAGLVQVDALTHSPDQVSTGLAYTTHNDKTYSVSQRPADETLYVSRKQMLEETQKYRAKLFANRDETRAPLIDDSLLNLDFSENGGGVNVFQMPKPKEVVEIVGCRQEKEMFYGHDAAVFSAPGDRIVLSIPQRENSFTLFASIRLNDLSKASNPILSIGDVKKGSLHWQINYMGELQLLLDERTNEAPVKYSSGPAVRKNDVGGWLHIATVVDAERKTVSHYLDGKRLGVCAMKDSVDVNFTDMQLGSWLHLDRREKEYGYFNGQIGEFLLFGRALTDEEIRDRITFIR